MLGQHFQNENIKRQSSHQDNPSLIGETSPTNHLISNGKEQK